VTPIPTTRGPPRHPAMRGSGALAAVTGAALSGVVGIAVVGGSLTSPTAPLTGAGVAGGLRAGSVPAAYAGLVSAAGGVCAAFPAAVLAAQVQAESGWNPAARSPTGAAGISQFEPATWAAWGRDSDGDGISSPLDPGDAIPAQARFDCSLAAEMATAIAAGRVIGLSVTDAALAAYNAGPGAVLAARGIPQNGQTPGYVTEIDTLTGTYAAAAAVVPPAAGAGAGVSSAFGAAMVTAAETELGLPYVWGGGDVRGPTAGLGGSGPVGFDCSGLVLFAAYTASGGTITLPHDSDVQGRVGTQVASGLGSTIDLGLLQPGDVVAFNLDGGSHLSHIGIYVGGGLLLHASHPGVGGGVKLESLTEGYWQPYTWSVRRYG